MDPRNVTYESLHPKLQKNLLQYGVISEYISGGSGEFNHVDFVRSHLAALRKLKNPSCLKIMLKSPGFLGYQLGVNAAAESAIEEAYERVLRIHNGMGEREIVPEGSINEPTMEFIIASDMRSSEDYDPRIDFMNGLFEGCLTRDRNDHRKDGDYSRIIGEYVVGITRRIEERVDSKNKVVFHVIGEFPDGF